MTLLDPNDRYLLLESLRPPAGYAFDEAVGTTFSLDLLALLTAPIAFTMFDWDASAGAPDPLVLLDTVRRYADKIAIFCQAGQIVVPAVHPLLYSYLENSVVEVLSPSEHGVFHPKVWALRYKPLVAGEFPLYRLLVMSRNLTFDRSWDTVLVLEGTLSNRKNAYNDNHPLGDFFQALPKMAARDVPSTVQKRIDRFQHELRRVDFEPPQGFSSMSFWPMGLPEKRRSWPFEGRIDRMLVVSPFLTTECLFELTKNGKEHILVSRGESIEQLTMDQLQPFGDRLFVLSPEANAEETDADEASPLTDIPLTGLHAKLYVADAGWDARLWLGSANATFASYHHNVEFLVELVGKRGQCGIDALLAPAASTGQVAFIDLLKRVLPSQNVSPLDPVQEALDQQLRMARRNLAAMRWLAEITLAETPESFAINLYVESGEKASSLGGAEIKCWPITLSAATYSVPIDFEAFPVARFGNCSLEALTSFFAFSVTVTQAGVSQTTEFVVNVPVQGLPSNRQRSILQTILRNREQVLRFIMLLLAGDQAETTIAALADDHFGFGISLRPDGVGSSTPLFETLMHALERDPARLRNVHQLVEDLRQSSESDGLLPEGFDTIWQPIWTIAKQRLAE